MPAGFHWDANMYHYIVQLGESFELKTKGCRQSTTFPNSSCLFRQYIHCMDLIRSFLINMTYCTLFIYSAQETSWMYLLKSNSNTNKLISDKRTKENFSDEDGYLSQFFQMRRESLIVISQLNKLLNFECTKSKQQKKETQMI